MSPRNVVDSRSRTSYEVVKRLGKGAFATCYLVSARQRAHPNVQCYALKKFPRKAADDDQRFVKICNEVAVHGRLCSGSCHPNVVGMLTAFDSEEGDVCMLLEYCANGNLADFVERTEGCALGEAEAVGFLRQLLNAVEYIHTVHDVLHRDIKPGNVLLSSNYTVKLADFGLACTVEECRRRLSVCGTPNYVSPEIIRFRGHSFASDYWAIACTFFFMLSGVTPFQTSTIKSTYSKICRSDYHYPANFTGGPKARDFIARVLCVEPVHRMSMREMFLHPLFQSFRRSSMSNLLTDSNGNIVELPVKPLSRCQSVFDFNSTRSTPDPEQQLMSTYSLFYRALQSVFTPSDYSEFSLLLIDRPLPETFVVKWVDYTNKFGFGAMLKNGVRSVCFNDESILSTIDCETFVYHPLRTHRGCTIWDSNTLLCPAFQSKIQTARYVRSYMDQELTSSVRLEEPDDFLMVELCRSTYLMEVIKMDEMIVFLISDGSMQINFTSTRLKVLLQREHDSLYLYAVTANGLTSYLLDDYVRTSDVQPPQWTPCVMDAIHSVIQRRSVARRSTKC
ncbi:Protein kinase domain-containing protein [Aphelenchoides fujianensis]|nr:Protein kinase domain-containing protein [Aphelenchoides fujianensis]